MNDIQNENINRLNSELSEIQPSNVDLNDNIEFQYRQKNNKGTYNVSKNGLYYKDDNKDIQRIGNYIKPLANTVINSKHYLLLEFMDINNNIVDCKLSREDIADTSRTLAKKLCNIGYQMELYHSAKIQNLLNEYIPNQNILAVDRIGWHENSYVLPHKIIGCNDDSIKYYGNVLKSKYESKGSIEEWKEHIASHCTTIPLQLGLCAGFSSILTHFVGLNGFGLHFYGESSKGKTSLLNVIATIFGKPRGMINKWNATRNAIEMLGYNNNHSICILDELSEASLDTIDSIYMLIDGCGKSRMTKDTELREPKHWKTVLLSTGELNVSDFAKRKQKQLNAGEQVRLINYYVDEIFIDKNHVETLSNNCNEYYGTASIEFINYIITNKIQIKHRFDKIANELNMKHNPSHNQANRVIKYFALMQLAGNLAIECNILPEDMPINNTINAVLYEWCNENQMDKESDEIIQKLLNAVENHGSDYFVSETDPFYTKYAPNQIGIIRKVNNILEYHLIPAQVANKLYNATQFRREKTVLLKYGIIQDVHAIKLKNNNTAKLCKINTEKLKKYQKY